MESSPTVLFTTMEGMYILISNNKLLEEINAPSLEDFYKITIVNNDSLSRLKTIILKPFQKIKQC